MRIHPIIFPVMFLVLPVSRLGQVVTSKLLRRDPGAFCVVVLELGLSGVGFGVCGF